MIHERILQFRLEPADVIIAKKRGWYVLDHYIVYLGMQHGKMYFIANDMSGGVRIFDEQEVEKLIAQFEPTQVRKFKGSYWERQQALKRAEGELGKRYNLISFNCESLANYIQFGKRESKQSQNWLIAAGALLLLLVFVKSSKRL